MKRILSIIIVCMILISAQFVGYSEDNSIQVVLDGTVLEIEPGAKIIEGSTYIPMVQFVKTSAYEAEVQINSTSSSNEYIINRKKIGRVIAIRESNGTISEVTINGIIRKVNIKAAYEQGQIWVPIVFLVEHLGGQATWSELTRRVMVESYKPIVYKDKNLETAIRSSAGITAGNIFKCDLNLLNTLVVTSSGIIDLEGIQYATNLVHLDLSNNKIVDVTPLRQLTKLTTLYLKGNPVADYSPLAAVYNHLNLRDFNMKFTGIYDKNIETAIRTKIGKLTGDLTLEDLAGITELDLENKAVVDLQGLQYLVGLKKLYLRENNIQFIEPLKNLIELEVLALNKNSIENIKPLSYLKNLVELDLYGNKVTDISPLIELPKLKQLSLMENKVSDVSKLGNLVNLEILVLQNNEITDISNLKNLVNLKVLYLRQNKITDISMLGDLTNLVTLVLQNNQISDVTGIKDLKNLEELYLSSNLVTDFSALKDLCTRLKKYDFPDPNANSTTQVTPVQTLAVGITASPDATPTPATQPTSITPTASIQPTLTPGATASIQPTATPDATSGPVSTDASTIIGEVVQRFYIDKPFYFVNDKKLSMDVSPIIRNGRTFLPVRYVAESLGALVEWSEPEKKITVILGDTKVEMLLNTDLALVNGETKLIDVPPFIESGRTLVPFRFLSESLGCEVEWDDDLKCAIFYNAAYAANHPDKFIKQ